MLNKEDRDTFRNYAWEYFKFHADQRMKTFNFFLIAEGLFAGAIATLIKTNGAPTIVKALSVVFCLLSIIFWKIDQRNKRLVKNGEEAVKYLDDLYDLPNNGKEPHVLKIFTRDDFHTDKAKQIGRPFIEAHYSYTWCLSCVFAIFLILGISLLFL